MHRLETPTTLPFAIGTFDTIGPLSRADFPHRHTFHEIVYLTGGQGAHVVDLTRAELRPPHLCVIEAGQVHHWDASGLAGHVLLFTDDFLDHPGDAALLRALSAHPGLPLDEQAHAATAGLVAELHREYVTRAEDTDSVLRALLHVLLVRAARIGAPRGPSRPGAVAEEFARLRSRAPLWSVAAYAGRIGVTPGHLTQAVKSATGRPASQLVREARVREAKRLLAGTRLTVRQVAARVGFADPAYFCRFFRRETGVSPGAFRAGNGNHGFHHDGRD
ncbi:AraC family transcriptional regulator [Actinokineospora guangxiensis]|uniref:AraC family transcriptional regulator n=1 Tax=Actinokineospora guangxiensis TaxID=1490288 RepID=A0ABW0ELY6_9PSEU